VYSGHFFELAIVRCLRLSQTHPTEKNFGALVTMFQRFAGRLRQKRKNRWRLFPRLRLWLYLALPVNTEEKVSSISTTGPTTFPRHDSHN
jgi:hypothetical protein